MQENGTPHGSALNFQDIFSPFKNKILLLVIAIVDFSLGRSVGWLVGWFGC